MMDAADGRAKELHDMARDLEDAHDRGISWIDVAEELRRVGWRRD